MGCAGYVGDERGKDVDRVPSMKSQGTGPDCLFTTQRERSRVHDVKSTATGEKRVRASHPKDAEHGRAEKQSGSVDASMGESSCIGPAIGTWKHGDAVQGSHSLGQGVRLSTD
jgi:hypothetical protein